MDRLLNARLSRRSFVKAASAAGVALYLPGSALADELEALAEEEAPRIFASVEIPSVHHGYVVRGSGGTIWTRDISGMGQPGWHPKGPELVLTQAYRVLDPLAREVKVDPLMASLGPEREVKGACSVWMLSEPMPLVMPAHGVPAARITSQLERPPDARRKEGLFS